MTDHRMEVSVYDGCVFYKKKDGVINGMICCHDVIEAIFDEFVIGSNDKGSFKYLEGFYLQGGW